MLRALRRIGHIRGHISFGTSRADAEGHSDNSTHHLVLGGNTFLYIVSPAHQEQTMKALTYDNLPIWRSSSPNVIDITYQVNFQETGGPVEEGYQLGTSLLNRLSCSFQSSVTRHIALHIDPKWYHLMIIFSLLFDSACTALSRFSCLLHVS